MFVSLYESSQASDIFRITEIKFDFAAKIFPSWYSVVNNMRSCCHYHLHQHMEIIFVAYGEVEFQVRGRQCKLTNNDILIINPFESHSAVIPKGCDKLLYYAINIDLNSLKTVPVAVLKIISDELINGNATYANVYTDKEVANVLAECVSDIIKSNRREQEILQFAAFLKLFALLGEPKQRENDGEHKRSGEFIRTVVLYIQSTPLQDVSLEEAAALLSYNKAYFTTLFKRNFGMSFTDYLNNYKINIAKGYIKSGNYNLNDVAEKSGFNYYAYFFKKFKLITGVTPSEYVDRCQNNKK